MTKDNRSNSKRPPGRPSVDPMLKNQSCTFCLSPDVIDFIYSPSVKNKSRFVNQIIKKYIENSSVDQ